ncbi:Aldehyde/histidinol dehydrogenase [Ilyonectria sp. MPI-CAGE-AT-0026]|nr:Aldehyde/histidinol dehydrogenase [Ilyonectria sp. MPI-CAGE-AT-0026]
MVGSTTTPVALQFETFLNVIDGKLSGTEVTRSNVNPSTLEENPQVPLSTPADVDKAVVAATNAWPAWAETPWAERQNAIKAYTDALETHVDDFARMLVLEQGKPLQYARFEILASLKFLRGFSEMTLPEEVIEETEEPYHKVSIRHAPLGIAVGIVPWNYPVFLSLGKIGPALLTGNVFILKPSPFTPYCGIKLVELAQRFFPPGVLQVLSGDDHLGPWLTSHAGVHKVTFTGSTATGKRVMESCSSTLKSVTLELGGNDAAIVCADVDPETIAPKLANLALANSGQLCIAIKRIYVHESIYSAVLTSLVEYVKGMQVGDGFVEGVALGPIANRPQYDRIKALLHDIQTSDLNIAIGHTTELSPAGKGFFISPTIVDNPPDISAIVVEEPFGPIVPVLKWNEEAEVIRRANDTDMGLGASVWTNDATLANRISRQLKAGTVWTNAHGVLQYNAPFSGVKQSGIGVEYGIEGLKDYCAMQTVHTTFKA